MTTTSSLPTDTVIASAATTLRTVLRANAIVSSVSGILLVVAAGALADILDVDTIAVRLVGAALVPFAVGVAWASRAEVKRLRILAGVIGMADALWVVGTVVLVAAGAFSTAGGELALLVGAMVAGFAVAELRGATALRQ